MFITPPKDKSPGKFSWLTKVDLREYIQIHGTMPHCKCLVLHKEHAWIINDGSSSSWVVPPHQVILFYSVTNSLIFENIQKKKKIPKKSLTIWKWAQDLCFHIFNCQIWLNILTGYCHLSNITKLKKEPDHQVMSFQHLVDVEQCFPSD
jgi:hypothetical protein